MKIGLMDVDGNNFPNLPLMKLSAYHKAQGDQVELAAPFGVYDRLYCSKVFTWSWEPNYPWMVTKEVIRGGTGYMDYTTSLPAGIETICPDYDLYNCECAFGFLTRGCSNQCDYCIVPRKEGKITPGQDIEEFLGGKRSAILMDNNVLAHGFGWAQLEKIIRLGIKVDFNQGLDYRRIDEDAAKVLAHVKWLRPVRMACNSKEDIPGILAAAALLRKYKVTPSNYFIYMLVKDVGSAVERAEALKAHNLDPFAQAYLPVNIRERSISEDLQKVCRWVNHKAIFKSVQWKDYCQNKKGN